MLTILLLFVCQQDDHSVGRDSSTRSVMFDLELSQKGNRSATVATAAAAVERLNRLQLDTSRDGKKTGARDGASQMDVVLERITYLSHPVASFEVDLLQDVEALRGAAKGPGGVLDLGRLAADLVAMGYSCSLQRNDPTDPSQRTAALVGMDRTCLEKLRHEFIVCTGRLDGTVHHYCLVDPRLRDQFALGQASNEYKAVLDALPENFVGSPLRLQALANLLCLQIAEVYRREGLPLPPWRKPNAMLSRWFDVSSPAVTQQVQQQQQQPQRSAPPQVQQPVHDLAAGAAAGPSFGASPMPAHPQQQHGAALERTGSGQGSAQFYNMLALHQDSLRMQQQWRQQQQQQQPVPAHSTDVASEKSNKPRRQQLLQQQRQQQLMQQQAQQGAGRPVSLSPAGNPGQLQTVGSLGRSRSGGWSELATIVEAPSPHHPEAARFGSSASGSAAGSSHRSEHGASASGSPSLRGPVTAGGGGKAVSLLARSLKSMGQRETWSNIIPGIKFSNKSGSDSREGSRSRRGSHREGRLQ